MDQDEILRTLLEANQREREAAVEALLAPLTLRERSLIRDAAVMAFVLGTLHGRAGKWGDPHPKDSAVYFETLASVARETENYAVLRGIVHQYSGIGGN